MMKCPQCQSTEFSFISASNATGSALSQLAKTLLSKNKNLTRGHYKVKCKQCGYLFPAALYVD